MNDLIDLIMCNILCVVGLLTVKMLITIDIRLMFNKKVQYKRFKKEVSFVKRWFLISIDKTVNDKYSKQEKKIIKRKKIVKHYFYMNIIIHLIMLVNALFLILAVNDFVSIAQAVCVTVASLFVILILLVWFAIIDEYAHHKQNKARRKW